MVHDSAFGLTAIWFTLNPNDINNVVKLKLAAHRGRDGEAARAFLRALSTALQATTLSVHDPLSLTLFFFREISLFLEHYVRVGRPSIYGKVSYYYAAIETNDRGALHLHGLLWLDGNLDLANLVRDMANPDEGEYRLKVKTFVDDVFTATLDEALAKEAMESGKKTTAVQPELIHDAEWLSGEFEREAKLRRVSLPGPSPHRYMCEVLHQESSESGCGEVQSAAVPVPGSLETRARDQLHGRRAPRGEEGPSDVN
jgi:hypothetical protein